MKTKVTQKEWNDKRDQFLCAIIQISGMPIYMERSISDANALTSELYEVEEEIEEQEQSQDTRPFNPKVVEIFNTYLPKEIAPLAIEAHKRSCKENGYLVLISDSLEFCLLQNINWVGQLKYKLGDYRMLFRHVKGNTITATPEQLREWFPEAYKGGEK